MSEVGEDTETLKDFYNAKLQLLKLVFFDYSLQGCSDTRILIKLKVSTLKLWPTSASKQKVVAL